MKTTHQFENDPSDIFLDRAIQAILVQPIPVEIRQGIIERSATWREGSTPSHSERNLRSHILVLDSIVSDELMSTPKASPAMFRRRLALIATVTFIMIVAATTFLFHPNDSWAQVTKTLRTKPWSLGKYTTPDGERHEDWISFSRGVTAHRHGDLVTFTDHRLCVTYLYNTKEKTLTRRLDDKKPDTRLDEVLQQILSGVEKPDDSAAGIEIFSLQRGATEKHGRKWVNYELNIRESGEKNHINRVMFLVDPTTHLPHFVIASDPRMSPPTIEIELSFPAIGPIDIYDMGVPRDGHVIDFVPADDIRRVISEIKSSAERFQQHVALNVMSDADAPWYIGTPFAVWRNGTSCRLVGGVVDSKSAEPQVPATDADRRQWWKLRWSELIHIPIEVCDGSVLWNNEAMPKGLNKSNPMSCDGATYQEPKWTSRSERHPWPAGSSPLAFAYPARLVTSVGRDKSVLNFNPADGPPNTIMISLTTDGTAPPSGEERFWIDTHRSYMVVRHDQVAFESTNNMTVEVVKQSVVVESADRSPQGIWYPTLMRHKSNFEIKDEKITRHYLNFNVNLKDDLFKPTPASGEVLE